MGTFYSNWHQLSPLLNKSKILIYYLLNRHPIAGKQYVDVDDIEDKEVDGALFSASSE